MRCILKGAGQDATVGQVDFKVVVRHASDGPRARALKWLKSRVKSFAGPIDGRTTATGMCGCGSERWLTVKCGDLILSRRSATRPDGSARCIRPDHGFWAPA
jgi:hypothetical protein